MKHLRILSLILLLSLAVACIAAASNAPFFFIQLADPQLGFTNSNRDMVPEIANFTKAVEDINRLRPAFVLISGDMTHKTHDPAQIRAFWRIAHDISKDIPLRLVPGNHDVTNSPTAADVRSYTRLFGPDHYSFSYNGAEFLVLDTNLLSKTADSDLRDAQIKWFETELAATKARNPAHIFVCTHQPWFLKTPDEPDKYQNVPLAYRQTFLDLMNKCGVEYSLSGHLHREMTAKDRNLTLISCGPISKVLTGPLAKDLAEPPLIGFRIWRVYPDHIDTQFYPLDKVPEKVSM